MSKLKCAFCGTNKDIQRHHIVPILEGGEDSFSNRVYVCRECHSWLHGRIINAPTIKSTRNPIDPKELKTRTISFRVSSENEKNQIKQEAAKLGLNISEYMRKMLIYDYENPDNSRPLPGISEFIKRLIEED